MASLVAEHPPPDDVERVEPAASGAVEDLAHPVRRGRRYGTLTEQGDAVAVET